MGQVVTAKSIYHGAYIYINWGWYVAGQYSWGQIYDKFTLYRFTGSGYEGETFTSSSADYNRLFSMLPFIRYITVYNDTGNDGRGYYENLVNMGYTPGSGLITFKGRTPYGGIPTYMQKIIFNVGGAYPINVTADNI